LTGRNRCGAFCFLCSVCRNVVAVDYRNSFISAADVLRPEWNPALLAHSDPVDDWRFALCCRRREFLVVRLLHLLALDDEPGFIYGRDEDHNAAVGFDSDGYFGYLLWTDGDTQPTLRQLFVTRERRRRGLGRRLLQHWAERIGLRASERFVVESPNEKSIGILIQLGYAERTDAGVNGLRCLFTSGC
jgi:GNAT superfamily N-acetyltransferase